MSRSVVVLGAGIIGVSVAAHLQERGLDVLMVDKRAPGEGASFGNSGLVQTEAVFPLSFPRSLSEIVRVATNRSVDAVYHLGALPSMASPLMQYWWHSHPDRYKHAVEAHARLIATCSEEHLALARAAGVPDLLRPIGYQRVYGDINKFEQALARAERGLREFGVRYLALDPAELAKAEPDMACSKVGAIRYPDSFSVPDPHALTVAFANLAIKRGGAFEIGDAETLERRSTGWRLKTANGCQEASDVVIALGPASGRLSGRFGYKPPLFSMRGYHMHYSVREGASLRRPLIDTDNGFLLAPMHSGVRLTTGVEFAHYDEPATPAQLDRVEPLARELFPLRDRLDAKPWMGVRPATPDMLPIIGGLPAQQGLWCAFGHSYYGLTLGPSTGRLLAELMTGTLPFIEPKCYRPDRF